MEQPLPRQRVNDPAKGLAQLRDVTRLGRLWLETRPMESAQRASIMAMCRLAAEKDANGDASPDVLTTIRAILCVNCRRLGAAQGRCFGAALDRCMLLTGGGT